MKSLRRLLVPWALFLFACAPPVQPAEVGVDDGPSGHPTDALGAAFGMTLQVSPTSVPADGASSIALTATLTNSLGAPITGAPVSFSSSASANDAFAPPTALTNCAGKATTRWSSNLAGAHAVTATYSKTQARSAASFSCPGVFLAPRGPSAAGWSVQGDMAKGDFDGDGNMDLALVSAQLNWLDVLLSNGNGTFKPVRHYPLFNGIGVAACDLNKDGITDLVAGSSGSGGYVSSYLGRGDGTFYFYSSTTAASTWELGCADLNRDGNVDVVAGSNGGSNMYILLGNGDGSLQAAFSINSGNNSIGVSLADLNGDGNIDVVTGRQAGTNIGVLLNSGNGISYSATNYLTGVSVRHVETADLNGDGKPDIVATAGGNFMVYMGAGNGNFSTGTPTATPASGAYFLKVEDLNGDGIKDIVVSGYGSNVLAFHAGNGDGSFAAAFTNSLDFKPMSMQVSDFDGNGTPDLAITGTNDSSINLFFNNGSGVLTQSPTLSAGNWPYSLAMEKYPNDTKPILAYTSFGDNQMALRLSNGDGTFTAPVIQSLGTFPQNLTITDLNNDGRSDVVVLIPANSNSIFVYLGNGDGTLQAAITAASGGTGTNNLLAADLNQDGNMDLLVTNMTSNNLAVLRGLGNGTLGAATTYNTGSSPRGISTGLINSDGNVDIVVANGGSNSASIFLGNGGLSLQAGVGVIVGNNPVMTRLNDLNGDGSLDFISSLTGDNSVSVCLGNGSTSPGSPSFYPVGANPWSFSMGDIDLDGKVDLLVANSQDQTLSFLAGLGNGSFQPAVSIYANTPYPGSTLLRDVNGDGRLDALVGSYNYPSSTPTRFIPILFGSGCKTPASQLSGNPSGSFTFSSATVNLAAGAELTASFSDSSSNAFAGSTHSGASWDPNALQLRLGNAGACNALLTNCASLGPSWTPKYANLTGYWLLDGGGTPTAGTSLGAAVGSSLLLSGAPATYQAGQLGMGLNLASNGNAYLSIPNGTLTGLPTTLMGWVYWQGGAQGQRIFDLGQDSNNFVALSPSNNPNGRYALLLSNGGVQSTYLSPVALSPNAWNHVVASLSASGGNVYLNGAWVLTAPTPITTAMTNDAANNFGQSKFGADPPFNGALDDLATFNTALNGNDVALIYGRQGALYAGSSTSKIFGPLTGGASWSALAWSSFSPTLKALPSGSTSEPSSSYPGLAATSLGQGQVFLWHFDESFSGTAPNGSDSRDDSGQGNHGRAYNGVSFGQPGTFSNAYTFDGNMATVSSRLTQYKPLSASLSIWFNTTSSSGGKLMGLGSSANGNSTNFDRHLYVDSANAIRLGVFTGSAVSVSTPRQVNDGRWHHAAGSLGPEGINLYLDGNQVANANAVSSSAYFGYWRVGGDSLSTWPNAPTSSYFQGRIDEASVYNRSLSPAEVRQLWRRGANRLKFQVRACTSMVCADNPGWLGPDGTAYSYFSELNNNSLPLAQTGNVLATPPDLFYASFAPGLPLPSNPYLQYRAILESDDANSLCIYNGAPGPCSPELLRVRMGPSSFPTAGTVVSTLGSTMRSLSGLAVAYGSGGCPGGVSFNLSNNGGTSWYWYNGYLWQAADGSAATSNTADQLTGAVLGSLIPQKGSGPITYRAFLKSSGTAPCNLASVTLSGGA